MPFFRKKPKSAPAAARQEPATRAATPAAAKSPGTPLVEPQKLDSYRGDRELEAACAELRSGSWQQAEALLQTRDDDSWTLNGLARDDIELELFERWSNEAPSASSVTILGAAQIAHGWKARGGGLGDTVQMRDALTLHRLLEMANETLHQAIELDPSRAEPWAQLITVAMGTGGDQSEIERRFMAAHERAPFHPGAVSRALQAKCPKWGGDADEMFTWARWVGANAPDASPALVSPLQAHFETRIFEYKKVSELDAAMAADDVRAEVMELFERLLTGMSEPAPFAAVGALNTFLYWVGPSSIRACELNQQGFRALANRPTETPWNMRGNDDPVGAFQRIQQHRIKFSGMKLGALNTLSSRLEASGEFGRPDAALVP